ncbi:MAG: NUDIX domain-containing protein [Patescibacteria group bacterium]
MRIVERDIVGAHIYSKDGKLLLARATAQAVYPGTWKIPGGGVDEGETKEQALVREIAEETAIDASQAHIELVDDDMTGEGEKTLQDGEKIIAKMKFYTYKVVLDKNAADMHVVLEPHEFVEYQWVELAELKNLQLSPPSVELFTKLGFI